MIIHKQIIINNIGKKPILADVSFLGKSGNRPVVIFCHGYKGFKDWGAWNLVANYFSKEGFVFLKFNFSHNGGTLKNPIDFPDEDAFGRNTYSQEIEDLDQVINYVKSNFSSSEIFLIGHSRGGGIATLKTGQDKRIAKLATWAAVADFESRFPVDEELSLWKEKGVRFVLNGRTKQNLPHYYSFYEDFVENKTNLSISKWCKEIKVPHLIVHGYNDEAVSLDEAKLLKQYNPMAGTYFLETNHTFNAKHPWNKKVLPTDLKKVCDETIRFFNS